MAYSVPPFNAIDIAEHPGDPDWSEWTLSDDGTYYWVEVEVEHEGVETTLNFESNHTTYGFGEDVTPSSSPSGTQVVCIPGTNSTFSNAAFTAEPLDPDHPENGAHIERTGDYDSGQNGATWVYPANRHPAIVENWTTSLGWQRDLTQQWVEVLETWVESSIFATSSGNGSTYPPQPAATASYQLTREETGQVIGEGEFSSSSSETLPSQPISADLPVFATAGEEEDYTFVWRGTVCGALGWKGQYSLGIASLPFNTMRISGTTMALPVVRSRVFVKRPRIRHAPKPFTIELGGEASIRRIPGQPPPSPVLPPARTHRARRFRDEHR